MNLRPELGQGLLENGLRNKLGIRARHMLRHHLLCHCRDAVTRNREGAGASFGRAAQKINQMCAGELRGERVIPLAHEFSTLSPADST